jgi:16S rRNA (uracil1498-N3)-methyltransferase
MTVPHFFAGDVSGDRIVLSGDDAHHAVKALRITPGEIITVSNGEGEVVTARVVEAGRTLEAEVTARDRVPPSRPRIVVYQALAKHPKLDTVVARLAELGVAEIIPFAGARSVARWDPNKEKAQHVRLNEIAIQAAMQSRRPYLPRVGTLVRLHDIPAGALVLHEEASERLNAALPAGAPEEVILVVGPEGGLDPEEVSALTKRGGVAVSLGAGVLRTETAAFAGVCVALVRYGILG